MLHLGGTFVLRLATFRDSLGNPIPISSLTVNSITIVVNGATDVTIAGAVTTIDNANGVACVTSGSTVPNGWGAGAIVGAAVNVTFGASTWSLWTDWETVASANFFALSIDGAGRVDVGKFLGQAVTVDGNNYPNVNAKDIAGTAAQLDGNNLLKVDLVDIAGAAVATGTAQLGVNVVNIGAQAAQLDGNNLLKVDVVDIAGAAVNSAAAQLGVNAVNIAGQAAQLDGNNLLKVDLVDIAGVAVSAGTAQLGVNVVNIGGHAATLDGNNLLSVNVVDWSGSAETISQFVAAAAAATWQDLTAGGDFATNGSIGKLLATYVAPPTAAAVASALWQDLIVSGDFTVAGSAGAALVTMLNVALADYSIDKTGSPWTQVLKKQGTGTVLVTRRLLDVNGNPITDTATFVAQAVQ
jgi:hypothetical protein